MTVASKDIRAALLVRISEAPDLVDDDGETHEDTAGVERQEKVCRELAHRLGWPVVEIYVENDTSAFKRKRIRLPGGDAGLRTVRPEFRRMLGDLSSGAVTHVIAYDLDRVARDPRDLEDLIDVVEQRHVPTRALTGSLDLSTDAGITMARVMVAIANKSSRDTSRRTKLKHQELAENGASSGGGKRPYGFTYQMEIIDAEARVIRWLAGRIIAGRSLRFLARVLNRAGVPTVYGAPWQTRSVHSAVTKASVAGLRTYLGEVVGPANWPAIVDQELWEQVRITLDERAHGWNNRLQRWLTGVLVCGAPGCGHRLVGWSGPRGPRYWCARTNDGKYDGCGSIVIDAAYAERAAEDMILAYLRRADVLADLAASASDDNVRRAREQAAEDESQLKELAGMWARRECSMAEWLEARREIEARLSRWRGIVRQSVPGVVRRLVEGDIDVVWAELAPPERRDVARLVFRAGVRVMPAMGHRFEPTRLRPIEQ